MKILISGKGGSGKSTLSVLLAKALRAAGHPVLLIDADESNLSLHRLLGAPAPKNLINEMGGREGVREKLPRSKAAPSNDHLFAKDLTLDELPDICLTEIDGIKLLVMGKIEHFGEGCACLIGSLSRTLLSKLKEKDHAYVIIDAEAGIEHFGRRVDAACDLIIGVVDPTHESFLMAERMSRMAASAGVDIRYILNKVDHRVEQIMAEKVDPSRVIASIPSHETIFTASLEGRPLGTDSPHIVDAVAFLESYQPMTKLNVI
ncbi:MAG: P-loop NTPase [Thermodesulfobacteriota bacterium]|nr:P-loop NTPase [Thermodesulfobacteriota bacterium]